jgi:hypothetical protein
MYGLVVVESAVVVDKTSVGKTTKTTYLSFSRHMWYGTVPYFISMYIHTYCTSVSTYSYIKK